MTFGATQYTSSMTESTSVSVDESSEKSMEWGTKIGAGMAFDSTVCAGLIVMSCSTTNDFSFMVHVGYQGSSSTTEGSSESSSEESTNTADHVMPGVTLAGHEATEYKISLFTNRMTDMEVMLVQKMYFEDGTTALMPPQPILIKGLVVMSSMAIFHRQVKGITGCSAILEPAENDSTGGGHGAHNQTGRVKLN